MNISWDNIFLAIQIVVTIQLLLGVILNLIEFRKRNILLAYLGFLMLYTYSIFFLYPINLNGFLHKPLHIILSYIYFGPTLYLYLKSINTEKKLSTLTIVKNYILPFILCITYNIFGFKLYGIIVNLFIVIYFIASIRIYKTEVNKLLSAQKLRLKWFFMVTSIYIVLDTPMLFIEDFALLKINVFENIYPVINDLFYRFLHFPLLLVHFFVLSIYAITEIPRFKKYFINKPLIESGISKSNLEALKLNFQSMINEDKVYLDSNLTLDSFSYKLNVEKSLLSKFIKETYNKGFNSYLNELRINEFKTNMSEEKFKNYDIVGIAKESGFKSKATFYRVFKELEGITPNQYKNKLQA